ncbi:MAG: DUF3883 domain-containing protein [Gammaproteobacteria bacterium]|nr:DUF3883 domain-containing protein [Gammaproteobacteria bacterium]
MKESTIKAIHDRRKATDQNSQTLAGMLEATIHTGFHDPHKFVYEILQNANDAEAKIISFFLDENYLLVSYDGVPFEKSDIERICDVSTHDSAEQSSKVYNLDKVGYKGIGFKSVFCVSESVTLISNDYQLRFDKEYWENEQGFKHPWQIIPIPVNDVDLPLIDNIGSGAVNILMQKLIVPISKIKFEIEKICREHESILFLESIQQVRFFYKKSRLILRKKEPQQRKGCMIQQIICLDDSISPSVQRKWCCYSEKAVVIPQAVREQLSGLSTAECPPKIKNAKKVKVFFAAEVDMKETRLIPSDKAKLYCALPTAVISGLYYLINANFLLNQDRTLILNNAWNAFLLTEIGYLQFKWLACLASEQGYDRYTLHLISPKEQVLPEYPMIAAHYMESFNRGIKEIAFIPSIDKMLLKVKSCIIDTTHFFDKFHHYVKDADLLTENQEWRLISPYLDEKSLEVLGLLLGSEPEYFYTIAHLLDKIELYVKQVNNTQKLLIDIIRFFIHTQKMSDSDRNILRTKEIFLTEKNIFCSGDNGFLSPKESNKECIIIKSKYKLNIVQDFYITSAEMKISLENTFHLRSLTLTDFVKKYIIPRIILDEEVEDALLRENTIELLRIVYDAFCSKKKGFSSEDFDVLSRFPAICMDRYRLVRIKDTYLFDEHQRISKRITLSSEYYQTKKGDNVPSEGWKDFLQRIGVNLRVELECHKDVGFGRVKKKFYKYSDCFEEYIEGVVAKEVEKLPGQGAKFHPSNPSFKSALEDNPDFAKFLNFVSFVSLHKMMSSEQEAEPYIDLLWLAIYKDFELFSDDSYYSAGKKKTVLTEHFLLYCVKKYSLTKIYDRPGKYSCTTKLIYSPAFMDVIKSILPTPDLPEVVSFSEEQAALLGFRRLPSMQECLDLLVHKLRHRSFSPEEIRKIYKLIIEVSDKLSEVDMKEWNKRNRLPALSGELHYVSELSVFNDNGRAPKPLERWLNDYGLEKTELSKLADKLYIGKFSDRSDCDIASVKISEEDHRYANEVKEIIFGCLPWLVLIQNDGLSKSDTRMFMRTTLDKFYKLTFIRSGEPIIIAGCQKFSHIRDGALYFYMYSNLRKIQPSRVHDLVVELGRFLNFYPKTIDEFEKILLDNDVVEKGELDPAEKRLYEKLKGICAEYKRQHPAILPKKPDRVDDVETELKKLQIKDDKQEEDDNDSKLETEEECGDLDKGMDGILIDAFREPEITSAQPEIHLTPVLSVGRRKERRSPVITPDDTRSQGANVDSEENKRIGRLGEQRTYDELRKHYFKKYCAGKENTTIEELENAADYNKRGFRISGFDKEGHRVNLDVIWYNKGVNALKDLMRDHDIKIVKNEVERYIEVKATKSIENRNITLTGSEWQRMMDSRNRYRIFRVYNVDNENYFFHKIKNPAQLIHEQQIKVEEIKVSYKTGSESSESLLEEGGNRSSRFFKITPPPIHSAVSKLESDKIMKK